MCRVSMSPVPATRIVGEASARRVLLLDRIDNALDELLDEFVWELAGWHVEAVLTDTPTRRAGGFVVALRARPSAGSRLVDSGCFPWWCIDELAARIVDAVWEVTTVVPDVMTIPPTPPAVAASYASIVLIDDEGWHRLTA